MAGGWGREQQGLHTDDAVPWAQHMGTALGTGAGAGFPFFRTQGAGAVPPPPHASLPRTKEGFASPMRPP